MVEIEEKRRGQGEKRGGARDKLREEEAAVFAFFSFVRWAKRKSVNRGLRFCKGTGSRPDLPRMDEEVDAVLDTRVVGATTAERAAIACIVKEERRKGLGEERIAAE